MMETPKNDAGRITERIMTAIYDHIKRAEPPQENHHYNRTYEKIYRILSEEGWRPLR
jgi:hypothetical protein